MSDPFTLLPGEHAASPAVMAMIFPAGWREHWVIAQNWKSARHTSGLRVSVNAGGAIVPDEAGGERNIATPLLFQAYALLVAKDEDQAVMCCLNALSPQARAALGFGVQP